MCVTFAPDYFLVLQLVGQVNKNRVSNAIELDIEKVEISAVEIQISTCTNYQVY